MTRAIPFAEFRDWFFHFTTCLEQLRAAVIHWDDSPTPREPDDTTLLDPIVAPMPMVEEDTVACVVEDVVNIEVGEPLPPPAEVPPDELVLLQEQEQEQEQDEQKDGNEEEKEEVPMPPFSPSRSGMCSIDL